MAFCLNFVHVEPLPLMLIHHSPVPVFAGMTNGLPPEFMLAEAGAKMTKWKNAFLRIGNEGPAREVPLIEHSSDKPLTLC